MHIMIDVEALRLNQPWKAPLMEVGVAVFRSNGEVVFSGTRYIDDTQWPEWTEIEATTLTWWQGLGELYQNLRAKMFEEGVSPVEMCNWLAGIIHRYGVKCVWFAGPTYDQVMLEAYYDGCGIKRPWKFNNCRDFRTIRKQYPATYEHLLNNRKGLHVAEEDALFQVSVLRSISEGHFLNWE